MLNTSSLMASSCSQLARVLIGNSSKGLGILFKESLRDTEVKQGIYINNMAALRGLSLRVSWISCLLISSITCLPASKGYASNSPVGSSWMLASGSSYPSAGRQEGSGSYPSFRGASELPAAPGNDASGYANSGYSKGGSGSVGSARYYSESTDVDGSSPEPSSGGYVEEAPEPVFSDVSHLVPVHSYRSSSSYQRGRNVMVQSRYTPGDVLFPPAPSFKSSPEQPPNAPPKGGV
ncbi:hypothetical protein OYC64_002159 [Pagothenia borchgrevinki]|uniref:Uncharacterized protein n=2 Tax=Pagothenia borchgrevinki TaxID=8213 RepID=A0ABD2H8I9_PAGBO